MILTNWKKNANTTISVSGFLPATIEDNPLYNRAQELQLAGGKTAVFIRDTQPRIKGPILKEIH